MAGDRGHRDDVKHWGLDVPVNPEMYLPFEQNPQSIMSFVLEAAAPLSLIPNVQRHVRELDPNLPVSSVRTFDEVASRSVEQRRFTMTLLACFAVLALVLAAAGIYGVMAHLVSLRTPEIGVRLTLGANPIGVMRQILAEGATQAALGLVHRAWRVAGLDGGTTDDPVRDRAHRSVDADERRRRADAGRTPRRDRARAASHAGRPGDGAQKLNRSSLCVRHDTVIAHSGVQWNLYDPLRVPGVGPDRLRAKLSFARVRDLHSFITFRRGLLFHVSTTQRQTPSGCFRQIVTAFPNWVWFAPVGSVKVVWFRSIM